MTENSNNALLVQRLRRGKWVAFGLLVLCAGIIWFVGKNTESTFIAPVITAPAAGTNPQAGPLLIEGMGQPNTQVVVLSGATELGRAPVDAGGHWQVEVQLDQAGESALQVQGVDASGAVRATSSPHTVTLSPSGSSGSAGLAATPAGPTPVQAIPVSGVVTSTTVLTGTGQPGSTVRVLVDGRPTATALVDANGAWTATLAALPAGDHQVQTEVLDANGKTIAASEPFTVTAAGLFLPHVAVAAAIPAIPAGGVLTGTTALTGTGETGSTVRVLIDGKETTTATVDATGAWTVTLDALLQGDHLVQVETLDPAGNTIAVSEPATLSVPLGGTPTAPITTLATDLTSTPTATPTPRSTNTPVAALPAMTPAQPGFGIPQVQVVVPSLALPAGGVLSGTAVLSGTGTPGGTVRVRVDGKETTTATVDATGGWTVSLQALPRGEHQVQVEAVDAAGNAFAASTIETLSVMPAATPTAPTTPSPTNTSAARTTPPPTDTSTALATPAPTTVKPAQAIPVEVDTPIMALPVGRVFTSTAVLSGTVTPGALVRLLVDGQDMAATKADASGVWTVTLPALPEGDHRMQVETIDAVGKKIAASVPITFLTTLANAAASPPTSPTASPTAMQPSAEPPAYLPDTGQNWHGELPTTGLPLAALALFGAVAMLALRPKHQLTSAWGKAQQDSDGAARCQIVNR